MNVKMEQQTCFDCLQRRIDSDFSDRLIFSYGLSNSAFPFGSSAVVQVPNANGEPSSSASQFILVQLPTDEHDCLTRYVNECMPPSEDLEVGNTPSQLSQNLENCSYHIDQIGCKVSICAHSSKFSCFRTLTALAPISYIGICSYSIFEKLASDFFCRSLEDHVLCSLNQLIQGKASGRDGVNFLRLIGIPSFEEKSVPGCLRHPNIIPVIGLLKTSDHIYCVLPKAPYTLENVLHYSPDALNSEWHIKFLAYQLVSALVYLHSLGVSHGNICPSNVMLTKLSWSWLRFSHRPSRSRDTREDAYNVPAPSVRICCSTEDCYSRALYSDLKLSPSIDWYSQFDQWWKGEMSNFEYLLVLNKLAGRRWGDHTFHTVIPWVIDFSTKPDENTDSGWRDLSKSKWRLAKGDEQLDFTYSASESPHHVSDECLSELAVCSYKARRLPLSILRLAVRSVYEPNEYPSNMQRLYQWTPDECIPEFYCDPQIFYSLHSGMTDLAVPSWAGSPEEFIKLHRDALESEQVSRQIHQWIDITFGYKMSGEAAISAKNVMLPSSESSTLRSVGRRQLFTRPHPPRRGASRMKYDGVNTCSVNQLQFGEVESTVPLPLETLSLEELEEASAFCEHAGNLNPQYCYSLENLTNDLSTAEESVKESFQKISCEPLEISSNYGLPYDVNLSFLLDHMEMEAEGSMGYQNLLLWRQKSSCLQNSSEGFANDIFSIACIIAELYLKKPLFNSTSLTAYMEAGVLPQSMQQLPRHAKFLVEVCIQKDWRRRPSAKSVLESPYFPSTVKSAYLFISPLQILANDGSCLQYAANFAKQGALKAMGTFAAEMCTPYCLSLVTSPQSDVEAECACVLLKELMRSLTRKAVTTLVLPAIQKILQTTGYSHLKVSLLQGSFVQEIWNIVGIQTYLKTIHSLVISNLYAAPEKNSASAASVLLICTCEELGVPVTVNQTILPLIHCFGKGPSPDGIEVLTRIGGLLGDTFIVRQMLPLLKQVISSFINISYLQKPEPMLNWSALALTDCLTTLDGLVALLPGEVIVKEMINDRSCLHVMVLMQTNIEISVLQVAATMLITICQRIGPDLTVLHVLPQLKELFDELAFSQEATDGSASARSLKVSKSKVNGEAEAQIERRMDLVLLLYPSLASLLGIEKLRQCCSTWLLLEQFLLRYHNWKWEHTGESSRSGAENLTTKRPAFNRSSTSECSPANLLLNGVGWSIPQSQGVRGGKNWTPKRQFYDAQQSSVENQVASTNLSKRDPWFWFPSPAVSWDGPEFLGRVGNLKDELPWRIKASVLYSIRAHHGALRSLAVSQDESTIFTAGTGPGFKGMVQKWELSRINCTSGYYGHEEVVNDICVLSSSGKMASCDGTIHVWDSRTGKAVSIFAEPSVDSSHLANPSTAASKTNIDHSNMLNANTLSSGLLTSAYDGSLYTSMLYLESFDRLVAGTGNGSLRFIDVVGGQKLHLWRSDFIESSFPSLVSAICSCGSGKVSEDGASSAPSWIAAGLGSGHCRLFDSRSGNVVASWRAHDAYITKLTAPEDHLLLSSSLDKTLRIWDLRRNCPPSQPTILRGHTDGVSGLCVWGQDIISISKNKIGLSTLSRTTEEDGQQRIVPQKLYMADNGAKNMSVLSSISILPFSRLFAVGTDDGHLRICC